MSNTSPPFDKIALLGIGLIGSSLARAAKKHGLADHVASPAQIHPFFNPRITQIIQHVRLFRSEFQSFQEICLGEFPFTGPFQCYASGV